MEVVKTESSPIAQLFSKLGVSKIHRSDRFSIQYADDFLVATITCKDGNTTTVRRTIGDAAFHEITTYHPGDRERRDDLIRKLGKDGLAQTEIGRRLGVSQGTVSNVLRKKK